MKLYFLFFINVLFSSNLWGQLDFSGKKGSMDIESFTSIFQQRKLVGYLSSVKIEHKKDISKTFTILNTNADELFHIDVENNPGLYLLESAFNGQMYGLFFVNVSTKEAILRQYSPSGILKKETIRRVGDNDINFLTSKYSKNNSYTGNNRFLHEAGKDGFVLILHSVENEMKSCSFYKISSSDTTTKDLEFTYKQETPMFDVRYLGASKSQLYFAFERNGHKEHQFLTDILALSIDKMESVYEINQFDKQDYFFFPQLALSDTTTDMIKLVGYYFNADKDMYSSFYDGFASWDLEAKGDFKNEKYISFQKDIMDIKFTKENKGKNLGYLLMQNAFHLDNGKIFLVAEGYNKVADGGRIGTSVMGIGTYSDFTRLKSLDLALLEFDSSFNYLKTTIIDKVNNTLSMGYYYQLPVFQIGKIFNQNGLFDYLYTDVSGKNTFAIYFKNFSDFGNQTDYVIGRYSYESSRIDFQNIRKEPNTDKTYFMPNLDGQVMFVEWIKKKIYFDFKK